MNLKHTLFSMPLLLASGLTVTAAEDGKQLYAQMCAACHGEKGLGIGSGVFPPLADSEWLQGDANRVAQILLHGLTGPVTVKGNAYNLAMPAQGSLSDEGKVAVIRYIKQEFAGEKSEFSLADLQKAQKASATRTLQWTAKELLDLYPLPEEKSPISNLIMHLYHGKWKEIPDFSTLKAESVEEEHSNLISLKNINRRDFFGVEWTGDLEVPNDGTYELELMADDGAAVYIDDKKLAHVKGLGTMNGKRASKGQIALKKGSHKIKVQYIQEKSGKNISVKWTNLAAKDKKKASILLSDKIAPRKATPVIDLTPTDGKTRMYHNFIAGSTHRTMGVGFPQGQNIAFSTQDCQPDVIWKGRFINAGRHWTGRGQGDQSPLSNVVVNLGQGVAWSNQATGKGLNIKLLGYTMDKMGNPTFNYKATDTGITFSEQYIASQEDLTRVITINSVEDQKLKLRLAKSNENIEISKQGTIINKKLIINSALQESQQGELFSNIDLNKGTTTYKVNYSWTK